MRDNSPLYLSGWPMILRREWSLFLVYRLSLGQAYRGGVARGAPAAAGLAPQSAKTLKRVHKTAWLVGLPRFKKIKEKKSVDTLRMAQPRWSTMILEKRKYMADTKVISAKLTEREYNQLETYASGHNMSISAIIKLLITELLNGTLEVEKGELKMAVDPDGYAVCEELDTPFGQKVDRRFDRLRERGYPEMFISSMKEQILSGIDSQIDMLPKKFDARKMKDSDCGC